jgi:hypothetical protein
VNTVHDGISYPRGACLILTLPKVLSLFPMGRLYLNLIYIMLVFSLIHQRSSSSVQHLAYSHIIIFSPQYHHPHLIILEFIFGQQN